MRPAQSPDERELDDEIRGHLEIEIQQRIERGEDPKSARLNALREFGYVPKMREEMRRVWYSRWFDAAAALAQDIRVGFRSLMRAKGLAATVVITLALGIGANAAIFSVVRGVLLRPLVNRGEDRLVYVGQGATGLGVDNATFSVPEVKDFRNGVRTISAFGEFSTVDFTLIGLGEPRIVHAGVVNGEYFDVVGLKPVLGRLIEPADDGRNAAGVAVLTYRFWEKSLNSDPAVVGKVIRLDKGNATVIGVLEPSVPYPSDTEIIANIITSPHHLSATMESERTHRMTQLFGRLQPDATLESVRAELTTVRDTMIRDNPEAYSKSVAPLQIRLLRDQIASPARNALLILLTAAGIVFIIACSNVANLILARSVRREGELLVRAALGASKAALRRTLLAESLVLCGAGAALGVLLARPMVSIVARFAARFSVRALEVTVDSSLLWVGALMAIVAAILLAFVPKLPSAHTPGTSGLAGGSIRVTPSTNRRLKVFATTQIAFSFVMLAAATTLMTTLIALQTSNTGYDMRQVLAIDIPPPTLGFSPPAEVAFYKEMLSRIDELPGVEGVSMGAVTPWRDKGLGSVHFTVDGFTPSNGEELPRARFRVVAPGFFNVLGVPMYSGRDFNDDDRRGTELVAVVSQSFAERMFPNGDAINHHMWWVDPFFGNKPMPRRIIGIVADVDDVDVVRSSSAMTVYQPSQQIGFIGSRVFVHAAGDPYALVTPLTRMIRSMAPNQPVERAATLEDIRAEVLSPQRLNAFVFTGFAGVALLIAVVGVAGVLAFGVSARTREFGVRLAIGSTPSDLLRSVLSEGAVIVTIGIITGAAFGYLMAGIATSYFANLQMPGIGSLLGAAGILASAAVAASLMPAARASRVDVLQALRSE